MKKICLIISISIQAITNSFGQKIEFKVQFSQPLAVFEFVSHLSGNRSDNIYDKVFSASKYNIPKYRDLINVFDSINYVYWYEYPQYPYGSKIGGSTYFLLGRNLINSKTIEEFKSKSFGIIPSSDLTKMTAVLKSFLPVYREIIYNPIQEQFRIQISDLRKTINSVDIGKLFTKVEHFYNSSWNNSIPFILNFCPEPESADLGFSATAFYNLAVSNIPVNDTNYNLMLSVLFHESFHILYDEESLSFKNEISDWFTNNPSKVSTYANLLFNEAVTTALSSGYLYRELSGSSLKNGDWYNNKYIASMAVAMFPMVKEYLKENKCLDKKFIDGYIKLYEEKFPGWITDLNNVMPDRFIIAENHKDYSSIMRKFSRGNIEEYRNELNLLTLQEMKKSPITKVVVITKNNKQDIDLLKDAFKELNNWNPDSENDFTYSKFLNDKTYLIIVNSINRPVKELINEIVL